MFFLSLEVQNVTDTTALKNLDMSEENMLLLLLIAIFIVGGIFLGNLFFDMFNHDD